MYEQYTNLNISVIPIIPGTKEPHYDRLKAVGWCDDEGEAIWHPAKHEIADEAILKQWFGDGRSSIALVGGLVSNNLVYLDWDEAMAYKKWAMAHKSVVNATAVSQTASGYHVFFRLPKAESGRTLYYEGVASGQIRGEGQYVVEYPSVHPTGFEYKWHRHPSQGIFELKCLDEVDIVVSPKSKLPTKINTEPVSMLDEAILIRARSSWWGGDKFQRLWDGNCRGYPSRSEAHLALCRILAYWTGREAMRVTYLFKRSQLYRSDPETREKWARVSNSQGMTYGEMTVNLACRSCDKVYQVQRRGTGKWTQI